MKIITSIPAASTSHHHQVAAADHRKQEQSRKHRQSGLPKQEQQEQQQQQQEQWHPLVQQARALRALVVMVMVLQAGAALGCRISEFTCGNFECVPADAYCDGQVDCSDRTDEPRDCSPCNRTFYGDVGRSYEVAVERPKNMLTTFTCHLTFVAEGDEFGDIVQLTIQDFSSDAELHAGNGGPLWDKDLNDAVFFHLLTIVQRRRR